jgi:hypothetical protein
MKERHILFSGSMVRAARRPQDADAAHHRIHRRPGRAVARPDDCMLFVCRRSEAVGARAHEVNMIDYEESRDGARRHAGVAYHADDGREQFEISPALYLELDAKESGGWTPSIRIPRWASRITLEVIGVRVERL